MEPIFLLSDIHELPDLLLLQNSVKEMIARHAEVWENIEIKRKI